MFIDVEIYEENGKKCAYIADKNGGSGISVESTTYEDFASQVGAYLADYAFAEPNEE